MILSKFDCRKLIFVLSSVYPTRWFTVWLQTMPLSSLFFFFFFFWSFLLLFSSVTHSVIRPGVHTDRDNNLDRQEFLSSLKHWQLPIYRPQKETFWFYFERKSLHPIKDKRQLIIFSVSITYFSQDLVRSRRLLVIWVFSLSLCCPQPSVECNLSTPDSLSLSVPFSAFSITRFLFPPSRLLYTYIYIYIYIYVCVCVCVCACVCKAVMSTFITLFFSPILPLLIYIIIIVSVKSCR